MATLIINADDFGISRYINDLILSASEYGILTSTTIISGAEYFEDAINKYKNMKGIGLGIHLTLDGPFNITKEKNSIINNSGQYYSNIKNKLLFYKVNIDDIIQEYSHQIEKVLDYNITITHLDHHHHLHVYKPVLDAMIKVAKKYHIRYIRPQIIVSDNNVNSLKKLYRKMHHIYLKNKLNTIDGYYDFKEADLNIMLTELNDLLKIKNKVIEIVLHPGHKIFKSDYDFLTDKSVLDKLKFNQIISYGDL